MITILLDLYGECMHFMTNDAKYRDVAVVCWLWLCEHDHNNVKEALKGHCIDELPTWQNDKYLQIYVLTR